MKFGKWIVIGIPVAIGAMIPRGSAYAVEVCAA